jgi:exopolysaccharide biosynthesis polyprenyl glycosylphosphotransferase
MIPRRLFWTFDLIVIGIAFLVAYPLVSYIRPLFAMGGALWAPWMENLSLPVVGDPELPPVKDLIWVFLSIAPPTVAFLGIFGLHGPLYRISIAKTAITSVVSTTAGFSLVTLILFALKNPGWSRLFIFSFTAASAAGLLIYRLLLRYYFVVRRAAGYDARNVVIIGQHGSVQWINAYMQHHSADYNVLGCLRIPGDEVEQDPAISNLGSVYDLGAILIHRPIHDVIVIQSASGEDWMAQIIKDCDYFGITLRILPEAILLSEPRFIRMVNNSDPLGLPAILLATPQSNSEALFLKRIFDVVVSAAALIVLSPLFVAIALSIKIMNPKQEVFYRWHVVGRNGVEFTGYKFTTMVSNADDLRGELTHRNEMSGPVFKIKDDPRITKLGKFLRKYSLNELPQLWSVLKGDMSLVGPRPAFRHELERYEFWHKRKLSISPGITCLWQVSGRNKISQFDDWVKLDLEYIDNWSFWLDIKILFRTVWTVLAGSGS